MKPFKPPTILNRAKAESSHLRPDREPPKKKRRISQEPDGETPNIERAASSRKSQETKKITQAPRRDPLSAVQNLNNESPPAEREPEKASPVHYNILWRKFTTKKNKTWDGDGILSVKGAVAILHDVSGKELGRGACEGPLLIGAQLPIAGREIEVESSISREDFLAGRPFLGRAKPPSQAAPPNEGDRKGIGTAKTQVKIDRIPHKETNRTSTPAAPLAKPLITSFKTPLLNNTVLGGKKNSSIPVPRHDPNAEGALVMKRPKSAPKGKQIVDVVVDPLLMKRLREHQRAGVAFMYECVMGMKGYTGEGAILADEMGLGKTLQTIALIWTLLKQSPIHEDAPVVKKVMIVCPVTLINNWRKEFIKWLGRERVGVFIAGNKNTRLTDFTLGRAYSVMIIGYERLRNVQADLQKGPGIDLVIADEGHRLKTAQNKAAQAIKSLNTERRIILSGTPLQNDLTEFFTMVDFVNPGLLSKYSTFKREFETPILRSRQPGASAEDVEKGEARSEELAEITGMFILRRTAEILSKYLPPKTEYILFCEPTDAQASVYRAILKSPLYNAALGSPALSLELINVLKKVCNSPSLLLRKSDKGEEATKPELLEHIPAALLRSPGASSKLQVLDSLLHHLHTTSPSEKVVLVSNYTSTLDLLSNLLTSLSYPHLRLDGSTPPPRRQELVDRFNRSPAATCFAFLLSAKAGGVGLNLVGASRAVLFDLDWNPATDLQAMARVHRDGQTRPVHIYRLLLGRGALDEKIFQRQVGKTGLAERIVDGKGGGGASAFTKEELKDLFSLERKEGGNVCPTHAMLGCECGGLGTRVERDGGEGKVNGEEDEEEDEDGAELPEISLLPSQPSTTTTIGFASARDFDANEGLRSATSRTKMSSLMQYTHFDAAHVPREGSAVEEGEGGEGETDLSPLDAAIEDEVLKRVLREDGGRVGYVFVKMSS